MSKFALNVRLADIHMADPVAVACASITGELNLEGASPVDLLLLKCFVASAIATKKDGERIREALELATAPVVSAAVEASPAADHSDEKAALEAQLQELSAKETALQAQLDDIKAQKLDVATRLDALNK
jgi:hypothetical protein